MELIYSDAACLPARRQRPNAASTIFAYERAVFEFESFDWSPSRASYAWIVYTRWRNLLDPFDETWMKWCFWTINCFINTFFLFRRTDCSVLCLFIFVLWLYKLEAHSLFSKRPLVYGKLLKCILYAMCSWSRWAEITAWTAFCWPKVGAFRCESIGFYVIICYKLKADVLVKPVNRPWIIY